MIEVASRLSIDIAVIGAGPQALTLVTHLFQKRKGWGDRIRVFDFNSTWLNQWQHQFAALEIPHLRSPAVHHPDPNPFALRQFAQYRPQELYPPYDLPGTQLFADFCTQVVQRWELPNHVIPAQVSLIEPLPKGFRLQLKNGESVLVRRVVVANGGGEPLLPDWVKKISTGYPSDRLQHTSQIDLRTIHCQGEQILIIGSGLSSGHLAIGAVKRGARVTMMARRTFYEKFFDADPGWLGPKYLKGFRTETCWKKRWQIVMEARNGGSLTPAVMTQLRRLKAEGKIQLIENCQVQQALWDGNSWNIKCSDGEVLKCDRLWLATGTTINVEQQPLLSQMTKKHPIPLINGLPILTSHLRWGDRELYLMGGLSALQVGPTARNLSGARMATERIVEALIKPRSYDPLGQFKI
jgi:cation diffusion facilitator CzcD-associated flavoprotein CzcO